MKVAICISGIPRGDVKRNVEIAQNHFGGDVFYSTWHNQESAIRQITNKYFLHSEPKIKYHPLADVPELIMPPVHKTWHLRERCRNPKNGADVQLREKIQHQSKQIFAHDYLLKEIPKDYDMIVRMRYDTRLSTKADLRPFLERSYDEKIAIGFGTRTSRHKSLDELAMVPKKWPKRYEPTPNVSNDWGGYVMDPLILHPRELWESTRLYTLHGNQSLLSSEKGFYQMLSQPYGDTHECYYGGAQIEKYLKETRYA